MSTTRAAGFPVQQQSTGRLVLVPGPSLRAKFDCRAPPPLLLLSQAVRCFTAR